MSRIYGFYFWSVFTHRSQAGSSHFGLLETIIALMVMQVVLTIAVALFSPKEAKAPRDERQKTDRAPVHARRLRGACDERRARLLFRRV
jgi:hypothetical protein